MATNNLKVLVVGCGNMGASHARAYHSIREFEICGIVSRSGRNVMELIDQIGDYPVFNNFEEALKDTSPDVVSINTYTDTHAEYAIKALRSGAHVFVEKPLAVTVKQAEEVVATARECNKKLVVGYILRVHPAWKLFIEKSLELGKPLVMRMNLNQQSSGKNWITHKNLMKTMSPIVDCGVHYVDIMCLMTKSRPVSVHAIGVRLTNEVGPQMYNFGQLQVEFEDGSIGWYEAGWGPMISETAFFVKDVMGPNGSVSIVDNSHGGRSSQDIEGHTKTNSLKVHYAGLDNNGDFNKKDDLLTMDNEPDHDELCRLEQLFLLQSIKQDEDLTNHWNDAVNSLKIVLAADESVRSGRKISL